MAKSADRYRLALLSVHPDGRDHDVVRYVADPFRGFEFGDFATEGVRGNWADTLSRGSEPW